MRRAFDNDIEELIDHMNDYGELIFEWEDVPYFIDFCSPLNTKGGAYHQTHRRICVFDLEKWQSLIETASVYELDFADMLDNHYINGKRLRDIIMDAKCIEAY